MISADAVPLTLVSGFAFFVASIGLYKSFAIGPVRLVAPLIASYPLFSTAWAALSGNAVSALEWMAVGIIVLGVSIVAALSDDTDTTAEQLERKTYVILWALLAALGFATSFAAGHAATAYSPELSVTLCSRVISIGVLVVLMLYLKVPWFPARTQLPILLAMGLADAIAHGSVISAGQLPNASYASVASSTFGMVTILLAWLFLKEKIGGRQWMGVALVFSGIAYLASS